MPGNPKDISEELQKIRDSKEFLYNKANEAPGFLKELLDKISQFMQDLKESLSEWLKSLFPSIDVQEPAFASVLLPVITWTIVSLFVIALLYCLYCLLKHYRKKEKEEFETILNLSNTEIDSSSWIDLSKNFAQNKQYRNACRAIYMSLILYLDEQGILKYDKTKTNLEYLQTVRGNIEIYNPLKEIIGIFEFLWYGKHSGSYQDYNTCLANYEKVTNG